MIDRESPDLGPLLRWHLTTGAPKSESLTVQKHWRPEDPMVRSSTFGISRIERLRKHASYVGQPCRPCPHRPHTAPLQMPHHAVVQAPVGFLVSPPTAGDNPDGLFTATAGEGAFLMAPGFQPWITRIDPNSGQPVWSPWVLASDSRFRTALGVVFRRVVG